jgi:predicted HTH transcriptional regulator
MVVCRLPQEIVISSVIHTDYSLIGEPLSLALYDDRLDVEIWGCCLPVLLWKA